MSAKPRSLLKLDQAYIAVGGREHLTLERETDIMRVIALRISGIGFFFYTRKGSFLYKISLYIITYHVAIIVYHCVSLSISQYIMSLGDT